MIVEKYERLFNFDALLKEVNGYICNELNIDYDFNDEHTANNEIMDTDVFPRTSTPLPNCIQEFNQRNTDTSDKKYEDFKRGLRRLLKKAKVRGVKQPPTNIITGHLIADRLIKLPEKCKSPMKTDVKTPEAAKLISELPLGTIETEIKETPSYRGIQSGITAKQEYQCTENYQRPSIKYLNGQASYFNTSLNNPETSDSTKSKNVYYNNKDNLTATPQGTNLKNHLNTHNSISYQNHNMYQEYLIQSNYNQIEYNSPTSSHVNENVELFWQIKSSNLGYFPVYPLPNYQIPGNVYNQYYFDEVKLPRQIDDGYVPIPLPHFYYFDNIQSQNIQNDEQQKHTFKYFENHKQKFY